jgi:hypothetical protein
MKRPKTQTLRRVPLTSSRVAHTPKEAAIDLVRLEFDAERLRLGIEQAENRLRAYQTELDRIAHKRTRLSQLIKE